MTRRSIGQIVSPAKKPDDPLENAKDLCDRAWLLIYKAYKDCEDRETSETLSEIKNTLDDISVKLDDILTPAEGF